MVWKSVEILKMLLDWNCQILYIDFQSSCSICKLLLYKSACFHITFIYIFHYKTSFFFGKLASENTYYYFKLYFIKLCDTLSIFPLCLSFAVATCSFLLLTLDQFCSFYENKCICRKIGILVMGFVVHILPFLFIFVHYF